LRERNPKLESILSENGKSISLEQYIRGEVELMAWEYFENVGYGPSKVEIFDWIKRLREAYFKKTITRIDLSEFKE